MNTNDKRLFIHIRVKRFRAARTVFYSRFESYGKYTGCLITFCSPEVKVVLRPRRQPRDISNARPTQLKAHASTRALAHSK